LQPLGCIGEEVANPEKPEIAIGSPRIQCLETAALLHPVVMSLFNDDVALDSSYLLRLNSVRTPLGNVWFVRWI
jgi:hypothetical protein